nr:hypothetical protein [Kibdelosporangium sp. MJ126-NF4]CEL19408.1 hypothetical protein [Kibdelosporangium sp. MJ126-NF4]CTQ94793.1 hypothetical protein [Kibdelosporangium sp. MJ126-NF4]
MSTYSTNPTHGGQAMTAPSRPGTLVAALGAAALAGLLAVINGVYVLATGGAKVAAEMVGSLVASEEIPGVDPELAKSVAAQASTAAGAVAGDLLENRAYLFLGAGVLLLLFGLLMVKANTGIRIVTTIFAVITVAVAGFFTLDYGSLAPSMMAITGWGAAILAIAAIVLTWLPANGSYAKALKQRA